MVGSVVVVLLLILPSFFLIRWMMRAVRVRFRSVVHPVDLEQHQMMVQLVEPRLVL